MQLLNNTSNEVLYTISAGTSDSCGTIDPGQTAEEPSYDGTQNVSVFFSNNNGGPFTITIPESGEGKVVTVGIYFE
jgi:hypothetical protein